MKPLDRLKELKLNNSIKEHPNVPRYAIALPKYTDATANGLTRCITDFLQDRYTAEGYWLKMREANRILAFEYLCKFGSDYKEPWIYLRQFDLPF